MATNRYKPPPRWQRGTIKVLGHALRVITNAVGDDPIGKRVRRWALVLFGASMGADCHLHGGSFFGDPRRLQLGDRVFVNRDCYLDLDAPVVIGDDVVIGHRVSIVTAGHEIGPHERRAGSLRSRSVRIMDGVWIGANATILPGVTIGPGAIVAAAAVVTSDVAADTIVAGTPARVVRHLDAHA